MRQEGFTVVPALDVLDGRCVRLREGVRERVTVEGGDPVEAAKRFAAEGARLLAFAAAGADAHDVHLAPPV